MQTLLTVDQVAARLQLSKWSVYRRVADGQLAALTIGVGPRAPIRIRSEAVERLLQPTTKEA